MPTETMKTQYDKYLENHIHNVLLGFEWITQNLPELISDYDIDSLKSLIFQHDASKYTSEEYNAYAEYFYGKTKTPEILEAFDLAWLHHQHANSHHWQHWLLHEDEGGTKPLPMPYEYIIEMVMDWWSFSWKANDLYEIFNWYEENKSKILLHPETLNKVNHILELMKKRLDAIHTN